MKKLVPWLLALVFFHSLAFSEPGLDNCADQFIDGNIQNAPTLYNSLPNVPYGNNVHLCYRDDDSSFFAVEYWPNEFSPRWTAYRISPENYGVNGCSTFTRNIANCYFKENTWADFESCTERSDPFHADYMLTGNKLRPNDFSNTGHDRGHIAPRQAFSWHICGTYQTFSMANMSPQRAFLNQDIWMYLEKQVLTWGIDHGPIYVVSGTTYRTFPHWRFQIYADNVLDPDQIYSYRAQMQSIVDRHHANFESTSTGDILRPKRDANPARVKNRVKDMRMPTGYFKVIYRPAMDNEPPHVIGFLLPHTFENLNMLADSYSNISKETAFWAFVSRIDLIEERTGLRFPGISDELKSLWGDEWFFAHNQSRDDLRVNSCGRGNPQGILPNSTKAERLAACIDMLAE